MLGMPRITKNTVTGTIYTIIFKILNENPEGVRWTELLKLIEQTDKSLHPKTINGCVWKLVERYPDQVFKPEKGLFKLKKYK